MPTQTFRITRAPEEAPLSAEELRRLLYVSRTKSEWEVVEASQPENAPDTKGRAGD